jgi:hypothetical protein
VTRPAPNGTKPLRHPHPCPHACTCTTQPVTSRDARSAYRAAGPVLPGSHRCPRRSRANCHTPCHPTDCQNDPSLRATASASASASEPRGGHSQPPVAPVAPFCGVLPGAKRRHVYIADRRGVFRARRGPLESESIATGAGVQDDVDRGCCSGSHDRKGAGNGPRSISDATGLNTLLQANGCPLHSCRWL